MPERSSVVLLLRQGLQAHSDGRLAAARASFVEVLKLEPKQAQALHLMGQLACDQGNLAAAEGYLRRSVNADPSQPLSWVRLGEVLEGQARWADAEACFLRAHELAPTFTAALYNRARMLRQLADPEAALRCVSTCLGPLPRTPLLEAQILQLRALLEDEAGHLDSALATLDQAIKLAPQRAALHHNRGVLLQRQARSAEALVAHDQALMLGLDAADAHYNRGNSLQSLRRPADALAAYRAALEREPQHALALYDTARLRWRQGDSGFAEELDIAAAAAPGSALAHGIKGRLLLRAGRYGEAATAYSRAAACDGLAAGYFDGLGQALSRVGRIEESLAAHQRAVELAPQQAATRTSHAGSLLQAGSVAQLARAVLEAEVAVRLDPLDQQAWSILGLAWRANGDAREAWLNDYDQHVQVFDLEPPAGWADVAAFNRALAAELEQLHVDAEAPIDQTLRNGSQTMGNIFDQDHPLLQQLKDRIAQAVDSYIARLAALPRDKSHPLVGRIAQGWRFSDSWSSRLRSGGFHTNHVHSHGWISSCYYAALPPAITVDDINAHRQAGWIQFGTPDIEVAGLGPSPRRAERPRVGRLVLFPSFMWHGTVPFSDKQTRLTVAFDVMPLA